MNAWIDLMLSFASGLVLGVVFAFLSFKSRLRFYAEYIEARLAPVSLLLSSKARFQEEPESSLWESVSGCQSKSNKRSPTLSE
jgi:hypothetical protein